MSEFTIGPPPPPPLKVYLLGKIEPIFEVEFNGRICPFCAREDRKSRLFPNGGSSTLMSFQPYYDEYGKRHYHDANSTDYDYSCSNGHRFYHHSSPGRCSSCEWVPNGEDSIRIATYPPV